MVIINGKKTDSIPLEDGFAPAEIQKNIFDILSKSAENYHYDDAGHLITELKVRKGIVDASRELARSGLKFRVFRETIANSAFWNRTNEGGFELKSNVLPSDAILDIYRNGRMYGTECSTAMIMVLYKALLDVLPVEQYNRLYSGIYLMNWMHLDRDLALIFYPEAVDEIPGDARYFSNPDVDPVKPHWQGENVYVLGGGLYYGHGIGISDAGGIIRALNNARKRDAAKSAYLNKMIKRQDYKQIAGYLRQGSAQVSPAAQESAAAQASPAVT